MSQEEITIEKCKHKGSQWFYVPRSASYNAHLVRVCLICGEQLEWRVIIPFGDTHD